MTRLVAIGASLSAALALAGQAASASPGNAPGSAPGSATQIVSATVTPTLGVAIAPDGQVSTGSSTIAVSISRQRIGGVLVITVAPTG